MSNDSDKLSNSLIRQVMDLKVRDVAILYKP